MPFPADAISVFTAWLRTGEIPDPLALLDAAFSVGKWVVAELHGQPDDGLKAAKGTKGGSAVPALSHEELADTLDSLAKHSKALPRRGQPKGLPALPLSLILSLIAEIIEAVRKSKA